MKKNIIYAIVLFFAIVLQTSVLKLIAPTSVVGDIVLMLVLAGAIIDGFFSFFWLAVFFGIVYDLVGYVQVGSHAIVFLLIVYFVSFFSRRFSVELGGVGLVWFFFFVVFATILSNGTMAFLVAFDLQNFNTYFKEFGSFKNIFIQIFYNVFLFLISFVVLKKIKKHL
ncbi:MAG: hypothetical protein WCI36_04915 [bacterium]